MVSIRGFPRRGAAIVGLLLLAGGATVAQAQAVNVDQDGLGLKGYDAVAYHTEQRAVKGTTTFSATHEGVTYRFSSAANRDTFVAEPARYLPAYGGFCAFGVSRGYKVKIEPDAFTVVDGRLYLNYDKGVQERWLKDIAGYIAKADSNWPRILNDPRR